MKILVVDDHALIREALRNVFAEVNPGALIFEATNCVQAVLLAKEHDDLDLILLDLGLPDSDGFEMLSRLRLQHPDVAVVVLSAAQGRDTVLRALDLGALGFIPKSATRAVMVRALQLVFDGGIYIPPEILQKSGAFASPAMNAPTEVALQTPSPSDLGITERQLEVLALMMRGKSNKAICRELDVAEATVKNHVTAVLKALKVTNRTEAVLAVGQLGWELGHSQEQKLRNGSGFCDGAVPQKLH
jgi:DNA-binding NarL/FixJ family response regulator